MEEVTVFTLEEEEDETGKKWAIAKKWDVQRLWEIADMVVEYNL